MAQHSGRVHQEGRLPPCLVHRMVSAVALARWTSRHEALLMNAVELLMVTNPVQVKISKIEMDDEKIEVEKDEEEGQVEIDIILIRQIERSCLKQQKVVQFPSYI